MNKSFKVVFSKARSALMVVNEATSSIQAKGTKTVIAVAAAMVAGGACAAQWVDSPVKENSIVTATTTWDKVAENNSFVLTATGVTKTAAPFLTVSNEEKEFTQQLWVTGAGNKAQASGIWTSGEKAKLVNKGTIYVTTGKDGVTWQNAALGADAGATVTNAGKIVVKNAHGMRIGTSTAASTIINDEAGAIYVEETGVGMELGGFGGSKAVNNGLISVGKKAETEGAYTFGVQFEKAGDTFTNNGTISAADADSAILVKKDATNSTINLEKTSSVDGLIAVLGKGTTINLNGTKDTLTIATSEKPENAGTTINVNDGADVELTDGKSATFDAVRVNDGKLSASIWKVDNTFTSVTVEEDGIFNITKLNSRVDGETIDLEKGIKGDRLLIARNQSITLNGGQLWAEGAAFTGTMKIGSAGQQSGTLTVKTGDYSFDSVQVYKDGALAVNGGTLTINDLDTKLGKTTVSGGTLTVNGDLTLGASGSLTLSSGELKTTAANLFEKTASGDVTWSSGATGIASNGGTVTVTDAQKLTLTEVKQAHDTYSGIVFGDVTVVTKDGDTTKPADVTFDQLSGVGMALANNTVTVTSSADNTQTATVAVGAETIGVAALKLDSKVETLSLTGTSGTVVIGGNGGNVLVGVNSVGRMTVEGTLQLGRDASSVGVVNADALSVGKLQVKGDATVGALTITGTSGSEVTADAALTAKEFTSGALAVTGTFAADKIASGASVTVNDSGVAVLGSLVEGSVTTQTAVRRLAVRSLTPEQLTKIDGKKYVSTNANVKTILQNSVFAQDLADSQAITSVLYIDDTIDVGTAGKVTLGNGTEAAKTVTVGAGAAAVVDVSKFIGTDKVVVKGNIVGGGELALINATTLGSFTLADGEVAGVLEQRDAFKIDNNFISSLYTAADKTITLTVNEGFVGADLSDAVTTALGNSKNGEVLRAIGESEAFVDVDVDVDVSTNAKTLNDLGKAATEEYLALPVTAGTYNVAYDAAEQVTGAIQRHNTAAYQGTGVWADVYYSSNAGKEIYGGQGYSADVYGGVIGVDYTAACGAKMGAALTVGTGDADSEKSVSKFGNDADFYGLSVYAGKNVGDTSLYVSADASYLWLDNDITGNVAGASAAESIDSSVFTIGLRADWAAYAGDVMSVTPHVGIRYTNIDVDSYRGLDTGAMDVVEMPVGVKVAGNFETAGWKVTPAVDFTVVPQVGDKQVDTVVGAVDVIDNLYNTTLGVSAEYGNFTFGLNYRYGFGNNDRKNNSVNANVRYMF